MNKTTLNARKDSIMIFVTKPFLPSLDKYTKYLEQIWFSSVLTNDGPLVKELESRLTNYLNVKHVILLSNGTLAIQLLFRALKPYGSILTTPFTFVASASAPKWEGFSLEFIDIDRETLCLDFELTKKALTPKQNCIWGTHVYGRSCDVQKFDQLAKEKNINIIYDASHTFGAKLKGKALASYGLASTLSFHATKIFHTIEGGAICTNDDSIASSVRRMRNFGFENGNITELGINAKISELNAAMGLCILDSIDDILSEREKLYHHYCKLLSSTVEIPVLQKDVDSNYAYFPIILKNEEQLSKTVSALTENGIIPRRYFYPSLSEYSFLASGTTPISEEISKRILCLPFYNGLDLSTCEKISSIIIKNI